MSQQKIGQILAWIGGLMVSTACFTAAVITFAFANFETKEIAVKREQSIKEGIDRIERRMDAMKFPPDPGPRRPSGN
jgi:hypothetical protein